MSKNLKNIGAVAGLTVISRVLGLVRDQLSAAVFGTTALNSAFITAFALPNLFRRLLGEGSLTAAFVPTLQDEIQENDRGGAFRLLSQVTSWLALVTGGLVLVGMVLFSQARLIHGHEDKWYLAADLTVVLFPYLALVCMAAAFSATLNVLERFVEPALSPIWLNLAMILALGGAGLNLAETAAGRMNWLCAGVLAGGFLQMAVPAGVLMQAGWKPRMDFSLSPRVREIAILMAPGLFGTAIYQINIYVSRLLAFSLNDSAASLMFYANRLTELPIGVFAIAVATVVYPLLARHAAQKKFAEMASDFHKGLRLIMIINVPAAAGLAILGEPIIRLLFQRGAFSAADTQMMVPLLALFAVGMPFFSITSLSTRAFYAVKDTLTPVKLATVSFAINLGLSLSLMHILGAAGLVIASTVAVVVQTVLMQRLLTKRMSGMLFAPLWRTVGKVILGSIIMSLIIGFGWWGIRTNMAEGHLTDLLALCGLIPLGVGVYGLALWQLKIEGREDIIELWQRLRVPKS